MQKNNYLLSICLITLICLTGCTNNQFNIKDNNTNNNQNDVNITSFEEFNGKKNKNNIYIPNIGYTDINWDTNKDNILKEQSEIGLLKADIQNENKKALEENVSILLNDKDDILIFTNVYNNDNIDILFKFDEDENLNNLTIIYTGDDKLEYYKDIIKEYNNIYKSNVDLKESIILSENLYLNDNKKEKLIKDIEKSIIKEKNKDKIYSLIESTDLALISSWKHNSFIVQSILANYYGDSILTITLDKNK